ncbi:hypothetical protein A6E15_06590 [Natrinema saccharevitans]|uniref:Peptidase C-terminal archaeal/bacterial domain-containing protein n=1 Tax=Natrinema saccharevitans TaxID=301967 RepID=A0A1S8AVY6_9EURY|nr:hypothetical protein A6E15_06590 [Natrinema saccharevitans]
MEPRRGGRGLGDGSGWWGESKRYGYSPLTDDPCSITISLEGPSRGDFDLYVTTDGSRPTRWSHDEAAAGSGTAPSIALDLEGDESFGLQVHANSGSGEYTLRVEERGR